MRPTRSADEEEEQEGGAAMMRALCKLTRKTKTKDK
jgi:hypothetical protein